MKTVSLILASVCLASCAPGTSIVVNPDGSVSFSGSYKPKGTITEVRDEK